MVAFDDDESENVGLGCALDHFAEVDEVNTMIDNLKTIYNTPQAEGDYDKLNNILKKYYEQPHLLDLHLDKILAKLLEIIRDKNNPVELKHATFNYMYQVVRIRGYKTVVRHLPHEVSDFEMVLQFLEQQDPDDKERWRSRFVLLLWLSIIVIIPFHMSRLDGFTPGECDEAGNKKRTVMERIYLLCKTYAMTSDACSEAGAFLTSKFITRSDVKELYLSPYIDWACQLHSNLQEESSVKYGVLAAVAAILKHGKREDLLPFAPKLLTWVQRQDYTQNKAILVRKYCVKIVQRIGMLFLRPRVSAWRYTRGCRSLAQNLQQAPSSAQAAGDTIVMPQAVDDNVPDQIEEIFELLVCSLRDKDTIVRWSGAKGIGRVASRLNPALAADVAGAVLQLTDDHHDHACHGACMAIAELGRRGLLAPSQLESTVNAIVSALRRCGSWGRSEATAARDSAAHAAWALARAYPAQVLEPYVNSMACALISVACFDREINCRRAASAAYQENVGRHGLFPHGIDVLTTADFHAVGPRTNAYLQVAPKIADFKEYTIPLIDHLVDLKVVHWDSAIRQLAAQALNRLTFKAPEYIATSVLTKLVGHIDSDDLYTRHGAILAVGEIIYAISTLEHDGLGGMKLISSEVVSSIKGMVNRLSSKQQFRGLGGELMRQACCQCIGNLARARFDVYGENVVYEWLNIVEECLSHEVQVIRDMAISALPLVIEEYLSKDDSLMYSDMNARDKRMSLVKHYCQQLSNTGANGMLIRMGYSKAIGSLPKLVLVESLKVVIDSLMACSKVTESTEKWAEARRDAIIGLTKCIETVGMSDGICGYTDEILNTFTICLEEYTIETRGDIGAWVREAAMQGCLVLCTQCLYGGKTVCRRICRGAVEKIDRTRAIAARTFTLMLYADPPIKDIPNHEEVKAIFPREMCQKSSNENATETTESDTNISIKDKSTVLWLFPEHTMPKFVKLLDYDAYRYDVLMGLIVSGGDLSESLVKHTTQALSAYLDENSEDKVKCKAVCDTIVKIFCDFQNVNRITIPIFSFLDRLFGSGSISSIIEDKDSTFASDILKHVQLELRNCKNTYKLLDSINVLCQLIQVGGSVCERALGQLAILLCNPAKYVRRSTATRTYEALLLYSDLCNVPQEDMAQALSILSETDWENEVNELRPIRNQLCDHWHIKRPIAKPKTTV